MAKFLYLPNPLLLLLLTLLLATTISALHLPPQPPSPKDLYRQQLDSVVDALIGSGDFGNWADMSASNTDPSTLPFSVTFFIPSNNATAGTALPPLDFHLFPYHIVPTRLTFANLLLLKPGDRLPTLLPNYKILVTNVSRSNFTIDDSRIVYPDLYATSSIAVHGIGTALDYKVYGQGKQPLPLPPLKPEVTKPEGKPKPGQEELKKNRKKKPNPGTQSPSEDDNHRSGDVNHSAAAPMSSDGTDEACMCFSLLVAFMVFSAALEVNLHVIGIGQDILTYGAAGFAIIYWIFFGFTFLCYWNFIE